MSSAAVLERRISVREQETRAAKGKFRPGAATDAMLESLSKLSTKTGTVDEKGWDYRGKLNLKGEGNFTITGAGTFNAKFQSAPSIGLGSTAFGSAGGTEEKPPEKSGHFTLKLGPAAPPPKYPGARKHLTLVKSAVHFMHATPPSVPKKEEKEDEASEARESHGARVDRYFQHLMKAHAKREDRWGKERYAEEMRRDQAALAEQRALDEPDDERGSDSDSDSDSDEDGPPRQALRRAGTHSSTLGRTTSGTGRGGRGSPSRAAGAAGAAAGAAARREPVARRDIAASGAHGAANLAPSGSAAQEGAGQLDEGLDRPGSQGSGSRATEAERRPGSQGSGAQRLGEPRPGSQDSGSKSTESTPRSGSGDEESEDLEKEMADLIAEVGDDTEVIVEEEALPEGLMTVNAMDMYDANDPRLKDGGVGKVMWLPDAERYAHARSYPPPPPASLLGRKRIKVKPRLPLDISHDRYRDEQAGVWLKDEVFNPDKTHMRSFESKLMTYDFYSKSQRIMTTIPQQERLDQTRKHMVSFGRQMNTDIGKSMAWRTHVFREKLREREERLSAEAAAAAEAEKTAGVRVAVENSYT